MSTVPSLRVRQAGGGSAGSATEPRADGDYVLYWMIAFRRGTHNFALERAVEWARKLGKPLVILEALRSGYRWASDRLHEFVVRGMADNQRHFQNRRVTYYPYLEPARGEGSGLLEQLASRASVVVTDDFPAFFLPRMIQVASRQVPCPMELVDSNGLLPMRAADKVYLRAFDFRRFLQKSLLPHLSDVPKADPLSRVKLPELEALPESVTGRWPAAQPAELLERGDRWSAFPIDHDVPPVAGAGGADEARRQLATFLDQRLPIYDSQRNQPQQRATSELSPYLHFGHISVHEVFDQVIRRADWNPGEVAEKATGSARGWWGASPEVESFLDELITWRELGYNMCWQREDYDRYESLPEWARTTLAEHADDERPHQYSLEQFEAARTGDELWNASQRQLVREGRIHNYLRMLWGKKILHWSESPQEALRIMVELNNKYALDGRNPNSYSGIFWVLGRYDRAWGPERDVFGKIRYMSSKNTARKVKVKDYIRRYSADGDGPQQRRLEL